MELSFKIDGAEKLTALLGRLGTQGLAVAGQALREEAELIMTTAKRYTPVDTGALRASGHVQGPLLKASGTEVTLGFGGVAGSPKGPRLQRVGHLGGVQGPLRPGTFLTQKGERGAVGYAVYVHENLTARHKVGGPKFLSRAVREALPKLADALARRMRRIMIQQKPGSSAK